MSLDTTPQEPKTIVIPAQNNYKSVLSYAPKYRFQKLALNNVTSSTVTIPVSSSQLLEFKTPPAVFNLSQSKISYSYSTGAATVGGNTGFNWTWEDTFDLGNYAYFGNASGLGICDFQAVNRYVKIRRKQNIKFNDYITNDITNGLQPSLVVIASNLMPVQYTTTAGNIYGVAAAATASALVPYLESQYTFQSAQEAGGGQSIITRHRMIPLSAISDTVFSINKDMYFPTEMYVRFNAGPAQQMTFQSTTVNQPYTGAAVPANQITLNNIFLFLAMERNQIINESIINKYMKNDLKFLIPWTTVFRNSSSGTSANIQIQLTRQFGRRLLKVMHTVWNTQDQGTNTCFDASNFNGSKITSYQTYLDNQPLQDQLLLCAQPSSVNAANGVIGLDDWRENRKFHEGSAIIHSGVYQNNWSHTDLFAEKNPSNTLPEENIEQGLDMDQQAHIWQIQATIPGVNLVHYTFCTFLRELHITPMGILMN